RPGERSFRALPAFRSARLWLESRLDLSQFRLETVLQQTAGQFGSSLAKQGMSVVRSVLWGVVQAVIMLMTLFFLLRDAPRLLPLARAFLPFDGPQSEALLNRMAETIHAIVFGQTVVAIVQGTLGGLAFWALGLSSPLLWGVVMTFLCLVPLLGAPTV